MRDTQLTAPRRVHHAHNPTPNSHQSILRSRKRYVTFVIRLQRGWSFLVSLYIQSRSGRKQTSSDWSCHRHGREEQRWSPYIAMGGIAECGSGQASHECPRWYPSLRCSYRGEYQTQTGRIDRTPIQRLFLSGTCPWRRSRGSIIP